MKNLDALLLFRLLWEESRRSNVEAGESIVAVDECGVTTSDLPVAHSLWDSQAVDYDNISYALKGGGGKKKNTLQIHPLRGKSLLELWVTGYHFSSPLTATLNPCQIYLKLLLHVL